jgi:hypothetical protein
VSIPAAYTGGMAITTRQALTAAGFFAAVAAGTSFDVTASRAGTIGNAPWCAVQNLGAGDVVWDCEFLTIEQCKPEVIAGNGGFCNMNPAWPPYSFYPPPAHHRRHHHS